jgi:NADH:ubiquinone oxidoreductase subunit F (NADH-binding)
VIVALPCSACGLVEVARVARYLAAESAGQCGPCVFGLSALAHTLGGLVAGRDTHEALDRLRRLHVQIALRGTCAHPDGALAFITSGLEAFADEIERHRDGVCSARTRAHILPTRDPNRKKRL